jgi:tRNA acetyltransferase TAN1
LHEIFDVLGDSFAEVQCTSVSGLLRCLTHIDLFSLGGMLSDLLKEEPWRFRYVLRILPIEKVTKAEIDIIRRCSIEISERIPPSQTFRITVEKRHNSMKSIDLIRAIASDIERKVNLSNPDWIVLVEIIQNVAGLSVIKPHQVFSSVVEMRKLGEKFI